MSPIRKVLGFGRSGTDDRKAKAARQATAEASSAALWKAASHLSIPCPLLTDEDAARDKHRLRGQFLARQDRWCDLIDEIRHADETRAMTPAAMPVAELMCYGARADVVAAVEHALIDGRPARDAPLVAGIEALEETLAGMPEEPVLAAIVAQAHMDLGWAWRGSDWLANVPRQNLDAFDAHFDRARDILQPFGNSEGKSPLFVASLCTLNASGIEPGARLAQQYHRLIDLNPMSPGPMRALGTYLSPRWYGSHNELELEARRTAALTHETWGAGGYTWVMFDTLAGDPVACRNLDLEFFTEGLQDILERMPDQHTANTLAAFCAVTIGMCETDDADALRIRDRITACADWIVRNHLTEIHPLVWAHAAAGFDNGLRVRSTRKFAASGRQNALCKIAELFLAEIADGNRIVFTSDGPVAEHC